MDQSFSTIPGWGSDADFSKRPGVPRRKPGSVPKTKDGSPEWQDGAATEIHPPDSPVTPVYGTSSRLSTVKPSSWLKRLAYRIPQDKGEHWLLLIASDRLDVLEHRLKPLAMLGLAGAAIAFTRGMLRPAPRRRFPAVRRRFATVRP